MGLLLVLKAILRVRAEVEIVLRKQNHFGDKQTSEIQRYSNLLFCGQREKLDLDVPIMVYSWYVQDDWKYSA